MNFPPLKNPEPEAPATGVSGGGSGAGGTGYGGEIPEETLSEWIAEDERDAATFRSKAGKA